MIDLWYGDCLNMLACLPDESVDSVVTDPPYGIAFMGKKWDYDVPPVAVWEECLRVLKPGGHLLSFAGARTYHRMAVRIEDAGFEIRDQLMWIYGTGFPKGDNLKPAHEPIVMARKPFKGTTPLNVKRYGTGKLNIEACRIPLNGGYKCRANGRPSITGLDDGYDPQQANQPDDKGRWPTNLIHDGSDVVVNLFPRKAGAKGAVTGKEASKASTGTVMNPRERVSFALRGDEGGAEKFFYCAKPTTAERHRGCVNPGAQFRHGATLRQIENTATEGNNHPTVKPIAIMEHLIKLVTPPGGLTIDPYVGSGTSGIAAVRNGFRFKGSENDENSFNIACARIVYEVEHG